MTHPWIRKGLSGNMPVLNRRLWRMIKSGRGQFIALVSVVMIGVLTYIAMTTVYFNLSRTQDSFYQHYHFADYFFNVVKAPQGAAAQIESIPGVAKATGRIQKDITFLRPDGGRGTIRLTSYQVPMGQDLNQLQLLSGSMFHTESAGLPEVLVDSQFARGLDLKPGAIINAVAGGKVVHLQVVGTAASPEFVYPMKDAASIIPQPGEFGVVMLPYIEAEQLLNLQGQINQVSLQLAPGASEEAVKKRVEDILAPYGNLNAYPQDQQLSYVVVNAKLQGIKVMSRFLPFLFFLIAAGMQFLLLSRMIRSQRSSIGIMKALGFENQQIMTHYIGYALCVSLTGTIMGNILGIALAVVLSDVFAQYFLFPSTIGGINYLAIGYSFIITLAVGTAAGMLACRSVVKIQPAESMRQEAPIRGSHVLLESLPWFWNRLNSTWKMSLRSIARNKTRFGVMSTGVACTVMLLLLGLFMQDAIDYMMVQHFEKEGLYDYLIHFSSPLKESEIQYWQQWGEVSSLEPSLEIPVQVSKPDPAGLKSEDDVLQGMDPREKMLGVFSPAGQRLNIPDQGVLLSARTARKLDVKVGDYISVQSKMDLGPGHNLDLKVVGLTQQLMGGGSFVSLTTANRILGESRLLTAVMVKTTPGHAADFEARLRELNNISSILSRGKEEANYREILQSAVFSIGAMIFFAAILAMAIAYNSSLMNFNERKKELGLLRVLGYTTGEIRGVLLKETGLQALVGIAAGVPLGRWLASAYITSASTDMYTLPAVIYPRTYLLVVIAAVVFLMGGLGLVAPRLTKLDLVETLKNWD